MKEQLLKEIEEMKSKAANLAAIFNDPLTDPQTKIEAEEEFIMWQHDILTSQAELQELAEAI